MAVTIAAAQRGLLLLHLAPAGSSLRNVDPVIAAMAVFWLTVAVIAIWRGAAPVASVRRHRVPDGGEARRRIAGRRGRAADR